MERVEHFNTVLGHVMDFLLLTLTAVKFISKIGSIRTPVISRFGPTFRRI